MAPTSSSTPDMENFIKFFESITRDKSYEQLHILVKENTHFKARNANLDTALDENVKKLSQLQQRLDTETLRTAEKTSELELAGKNVADFTKKLSAAESKLNQQKVELDATAEGISKLQETVKKRDEEIGKLRQHCEKERVESSKTKLAEKECQEELKKVRKELDAKKTRLSRFDNLMFKLEQPPPETIEQWLGTIFESSYSLVKKHLGTDLTKDVLADSSYWEGIRSHRAVTRVIPVPSSNSPVGKQMRIAASLAILASALTEHVFQPTYLLSQNELSTLLSDLSMEDPERETLFRSIILGCQPEKQKKNAAKRAGEAVNYVFTQVSTLLTPDQKHKLMLDLERLCHNTSSQWMRLQRLLNRIEPDFSFEFADEADDWKILDLPKVDELKSASESKGLPLVPKDLSTQSKKGSHYNLAVNSATAVLWPAFIVFPEGKPELFKGGFVLGDEQVETARTEEASGVTGPRRAARQSLRRNSIRNGGEQKRGNVFYPQ